jgi:hypothetical protein
MSTQVEKFDPKVTTLLPLPKVYQFFHAIGAPLGHYGEGGNNGRFHCVREELKRILEEEVCSNLFLFPSERSFPFEV